MQATFSRVHTNFFFKEEQKKGEKRRRKEKDFETRGKHVSSWSAETRYTNFISLIMKLISQLNFKLTDIRFETLLCSKFN